jgi:hypothetical protein
MNNDWYKKTWKAYCSATESLAGLKWSYCMADGFGALVECQLAGEKWSGWLEETLFQCHSVHQKSHRLCWKWICLHCEKPAADLLRYGIALATHLNDRAGLAVGMASLTKPVMPIAGWCYSCKRNEKILKVQLRWPLEIHVKVTRLSIYGCWVLGLKSSGILAEPYVSQFVHILCLEENLGDICWVGFVRVRILDDGQIRQTD